MANKKVIDETTNKVLDELKNQIAEIEEDEAPDTIISEATGTEAPVRYEKGAFGKTIVKFLFTEDALKRDFANAVELAKFVYDRTTHALSLAGLPNAYEVACAVLNGADPDDGYKTKDNPYLNKADLIPEEPMRTIPCRPKHLPDFEHLLTTTHMNLPHTDSRVKSDIKLSVAFRKYKNGVVTYQVEGPVEYRFSNKKAINKAGVEVPALKECIDPRTAETMMVDTRGKLTERGMIMRRMVDLQRIDPDGVARGIDYWGDMIDKSVLSTMTDFTVPGYEELIDD